MSVVLAAPPLEAVVWARLAEVDDPEIPGVSIVDLGIVHDVRVGPNEIRVELLPTFVGCPALDVMRDAVAERLAPLAENVEAEFTFAEPWTAARITQRGRERLRQRAASRRRCAWRTLPSSASGTYRRTGSCPCSRSACPFCGSRRATLENAFGPTLCRAIYYCADCRQPFEQFKSI